MTIVTTPNPEFNGVRAGVLFRNGSATLEVLTPELRRAFTALGYEIREPEPKLEPEPAPEPEPEPEPEVKPKASASAKAKKK